MHICVLTPYIYIYIHIHVCVCVILCVCVCMYVFIYGFIYLCSHSPTYSSVYMMYPGIVAFGLKTQSRPTRFVWKSWAVAEGVAESFACRELSTTFRASVGC